MNIGSNSSSGSSGNYFVNSIPGLANPDLCPASAGVFDSGALRTPFTGGTGGITTLDMTPDPNTNRIPTARLQTHVATLIANGVVPNHTPKPGSRTSSMETDMDKLIADDAKFFSAVREEYCYYEARYSYALRSFLQLSTSLDNTQNDAAKQMLGISTELNQKLNNLLEVVSYITEYRVGLINSNKDSINDTNRGINDKLTQLKKQYGMLSKDNAIIETQKEMVRYTKEKNDNVMNQLQLFIVLNAFAIGAVFAIYRGAAGT
jgi:cell division protein ZapA (FtsZ GTPase activity inhibitor)